MRRFNPLAVFIGILIGLAVLRLAIGWITIPESLLKFANTVSGLLFLGGPLLGLVYGAKAKWTFPLSFACFFIGLVIQVASIFALRSLGPGSGALGGLLNAVAQVGLPLWCSGLGAMIATGVKDRNILIPISIFLIGFDIFLVLSPQGFVKQQLERSPQMFQSMAGQIPAFTAGPAKGHIEPGAYVGPADFVFLAMFMIALYRFDLRAKETARLIIPVLLVYMLVVVGWNLPLPALVPIGACVLIANGREFSLTKDEKQSTIGLLVVVALLLGWTWWSGLNQRRHGKARPDVPLKSTLSPAPPESPSRPELGP